MRVDLFGDLLESIRRFDVESQRSVMKVDEATLLPLTEYQKSRALLAEISERLQESGVSTRDLPAPGDTFPGWELLVPLVRPRRHSVFSLFDRPLVLWDEPAQVRAASDRLWKRLEQTPASPAYDPASVFLRPEELESAAAGAPHLALEELEVVTEVVSDATAVSFYIPTRPSLTFHGNMQVAIAEARNLAESGSRVAFFAESSGELERVADIFNEYGVPYQLGLEQSESTPEYLAGRAYMAGSVASIYLIRGAVRRGVVFRDAGLAIFGSEDLFETSELVARAPAGKSALATFSADLIDLKPGDYVVHAEHGVAQFLGLREIDHGEAQRRLHAARICGRRQALRAADAHGPGAALSRRGRIGAAARPHGRRHVDPHQDARQGQDARHGGRAAEAVRRSAKWREGFAFSHDSNWQREFEDAFEFTETKDQLSAIKDIKRDMEGSQPMDRLLCGDVGYGKTEVVMRAAFKAMGDGKQVAVLAPTTVLAFQHFETFKRRFQPFPIRIEMLSRFRSPKEIKAVAG